MNEREPPCISVGRYHGTTVEPRYFFFTVPVPSRSRYYRVPRYFFTVITVAHNRWYRPTLALYTVGHCATN